MKTNALKAIASSTYMGLKSGEKKKKRKNNSYTYKFIDKKQKIEELTTIEK